MTYDLAGATFGLCIVILALTAAMGALVKWRDPQEVQMSSMQRIIYSEKDVYWLARNIYHEARGDGYDSMRGVAYVTLNRTANNPRFPNKIELVVLQPHQFSWTSRVELDRMKWRPRDADAWANCIVFARHFAEMYNYEAQVSGNTVDSFVNGADHYIHMDANVYWEEHESMKYVKRVGSHDYYREERN